MKLALTSDTHYGIGNANAKHLRFWNNLASEIEQQDVRALIWAGDIAIDRQRQFLRSMEMARSVLPKELPILLVRGNHDFWDNIDKKDKEANRRSFAMLDRMHQEWFEKLDIHHLEKEPFVLDDVIILGWDGWYGNTNPPTNDERFMFRDIEGCPMHTYMSNRAWNNFEKVLEYPVEGFRKSVAVTHFNPYAGERHNLESCANPKFYDLIKQKVDVFCCGHNHQHKDRIEDGCRVLNCGSDYGQPRYLIFEV